MYSKFCNGKGSDIVDYTPSTLHKGVRWFVDFTALDPARGMMRRKRYYIKDSLSISSKKRRATEIMEVLTKQLSQGWNPWVCFLRHLSCPSGNSGVGRDGFAH